MSCVNYFKSVTRLSSGLLVKIFSKYINKLFREYSRTHTKEKENSYIHSDSEKQIYIIFQS